MTQPQLFAGLLLCFATFLGVVYSPSALVALLALFVGVLAVWLVERLLG